MATGPTITSALEKMERDFECGICHERYKQPKLLDCTHSFCEHCLKQYRDSQYKDAAKIPCPVCRQETVLQGKGIAGLKTNFHLISIVEGAALLEKVQKAAGSSKTELLCEICDNGQATHCCLDCGHNICSNCRKAHLRFSATSNHTVPTLEDVREGLVTAKKASEQDASKCQKHKGEVNRFYCETCQELICRDCTVIDHCKPQHHYIDYEEASAKYKQSMNNKISHLKTDIGVLETCLADTAENKRVYNGNVSEARKAVQEKAARAIEKVKAEEKRLLEDIEKHARDHNDKLDDHKTAVRTILQRKQHSLETATDVTTTASDSDFLSVYPVVNNDLDMLNSQHPPKISGMRPRPLVVQQTVCDINLGQLVVEDTWELCQEFGKKGSDPGEFESARGIATLQPDEIVVADWKNERIVIHNNHGHTKSSFPIIASDITATSNQLVAANPGIVKVFNKDNTLAHEFRTVAQSEVGKTDVHLVSVAVKNNGNIIVGDDKRKVLTEHNPTDGSLTRTIPVEITPDSIAVMNNDRIVVSSWDHGRVDVVDNNSVDICAIKPTIRGQPVKHCAGVCCNSSGIYIAVSACYYETGHIHHYDRSGAFVTCLAQGLYSPQGITFTAVGQQLAVADLHSVKVYKKV